MGIYKTGPLRIGQIVFGLLDDELELGSAENETITYFHGGAAADEPQLSLWRRALAARGSNVVEPARHVTPTPA
jgi:hypothetical protein